MALPVGSIGSPVAPLAITEVSAISQQIQHLRNKLLEVKDFRETRQYITPIEGEKYSKDSKDILYYIKSALTFLKLPAEKRSRMEFHVFQDFMPIVFTENATAAEVRDCNELLTEITNLRVDFSSSNYFDSNLDLIKTVVSLKSDLIPNHRFLSYIIEDLNQREIISVEVEELESLVFKIKKVEESLVECAQMNQTDSLNIFDRDAEPKFLEVAMQTNKAAIEAITALSFCLEHQLVKLPDENPLKERLKTLSPKAQEICMGLENNKKILVPRRDLDPSPVAIAHPDHTKEVCRRPIMHPLQIAVPRMTADPYNEGPFYSIGRETEDLHSETGAAFSYGSFVDASRFVGEELYGPDSFQNDSRNSRGASYTLSEPATSRQHPSTVSGDPDIRRLSQLTQHPPERNRNQASGSLHVNCYCCPQL